MRRSWALAFFLVAGAACLPRKKAAPPPPSAPRMSAETKRGIDQEYYKAVSAYMDEDYPRARMLVQRILGVDPGHADALALRRRIQAAERAQK